MESAASGYTHVEAFSTADGFYESDEEEDVSYVTLDLGDDVEPQLVPSATAYRLIGLDTPTPYLQLHGTIMKGRHVSLLGTELIFTDDKENHDWTNRSLIHTANTDQRIAFQQVTLIPKPKHQDLSISISQSTTTADSSDKDALSKAAAQITTSHFLPQTTTTTAEIDKLTGLTATPTTRTPRKRKEPSSASTSTSKTPKKPGRKKGAPAPAPSKSKGKGKEKEVLPEPTVPTGGIGDDDLEDMYMDQ